MNIDAIKILASPVSTWSHWCDLPRPADRIRQAANVVFAVGQIALSAALFADGFDETMGPLPRVDEANPATPASYAFTIWGVIYLASVAHAIIQAWPGNGADPLFRRVGWLTAGGYFLCCVWLGVARFGPVWATVPVIVGMLMTLGAAFLIVARHHGLGWAREAGVKAPLAIYVGWLSAATFVNAADVLPAFGFTRFGLSAVDFGLAVIFASSVVGSAMAILSRAYLPYVATVIWALIGIVVENGVPNSDNPVSVACIVGAGALSMLTAFTRLVARVRPAVNATSVTQPR
ncbi:MAG: hypothetical protein ACKVVP_23470 [Chloroflexota bacterium]